MLRDVGDRFVESAGVTSEEEHVRVASSEVRDDGGGVGKVLEGGRELGLGEVSGNAGELNLVRGQRGNYFGKKAIEEFSCRKDNRDLLHHRW